MKRKTIGRAAFAAALTLAGAALAADRPTPSGLPVPRYVSLKFDTVNARAGPGDDHRLLWVYHARGLPVQVVDDLVERFGADAAGVAVFEEQERPLL